MDSKKIYAANIKHIFLTQMQFIEILLPKHHSPPLFGRFLSRAGLYIIN